jgi:hypothetical protein
MEKPEAESGVALRSNRSLAAEANAIEIVPP